MKKILAILLAGMMAATALAGCGGDGGSSSGSEPKGGETSASNTGTSGVADVKDFGDDDNITLKVWAPDAAVDVTKKQCEAFKALYPEKKIEITVVAQTEAQAGTQVQTDPSVAADVFGFASDQLDGLVNSGLISECAYTDEVTAANSKESIDAGTMNGKLYYYPETTNGYFLVYDKRVVSDKQAEKFEDVLQACKDAKKQFIMDAGNGFYSCIFTFTGGVIIDGFEDGTKDVQKFKEYDEDTAVATLQAFAKLIQQYKGTFQSLAVDKISSGFHNGTCGAGIDGAWNTAINKEQLGDNFGASKLPTINVNGEDKQIVSLYGYKALAVNASTKYQRAAQILAYYLSGEQCQRERAEQLAWGPTNNTVAAEDVVTSDAALKASAEQAKYAVPQVHIGNFWEPMKALGNQIVSEKWNPDDAKATKDLLTTTNTNIQDK